MKFYHLSLIMVGAMTLAISSTSCAGTGDNNGSSDSTTTENNEEALNVEPTGNPDEDIEAYELAFDQVLESKKIANETYAQMLEYYASKGDYEGFKKFEEEYNKIQNELEKKYDEKEKELKTRRLNAQDKLNNPKVEEETEEEAEEETEELTDDDVTENVEEVETEKETNVKADPAAASAQTGDPEATTPETSIEGDDENIQIIESINQQQTDCQ